MNPGSDQELLDLFSRCRSFECWLGIPASPGGWIPPPNSPPPIPVDDFKVIREIGRGGMGIVYLAEQVSLRRQVALKVLSPGFAASSEQRKRFHREAQAAARLRHPGIVPVFGFGEAADFLYYTMEYVEGTALDRIIDAISDCGAEGPRRADLALLGIPAEGRLEAPAGEEYCRAIADLFAGVADALDHARSQGVIHRDIKPANLILDQRGRLVIADFGLALHGFDDRLTSTGAFLGTPLYVSPEQALGKPDAVDHRSDIYSLGVTLYECLALQPPWKGRSLQELSRSIAVEDPPPLRRRSRAVPRDLEVIVHKCLEKEPRDRYQTAGQAAGDLRAYLGGRELSVRPTGRLTRWLRRARRRPRAAIGAALTALSLVLIVTASAISWSLARERRSLLYRELNRRGMDILFTSGGGFEEHTARDAIALFQRAAELRPDSPEAWFRLALARHQTSSTTSISDYDPSGAPVDPAAGPLLDRALAADPGFAPALLLKAQQLEQQGKAEEAAEVRGRVPALGTMPALRGWFEAERLFRERRWALAAREFQESIRPRDEPFEGYRYYGHLQAGTCLLAGLEFEEAISHLGIAQELATARIVPGILLGKAWHQRGDPRRAEEEFALVAERAENPAEAFAAIAWTWYYMNEIGRAWRANERGLEIDPGYLRLLTNRAVCFWELDRTPDAIRELRRLRLRFPDNELVLWLNRFMLNSMGLTAEARQIEGAVPPTTWLHHPAYFRRKVSEGIELLEKPGHEAEAARLCIERFRDWERKGEWEPAAGAAVIIQALGPEKALAAVTELLTGKGGRGAPALVLETCRQLGIPDEGRRRIEAAASGPDPPVEAPAVLGRIRFDDGDLPGALAALDQAIEIDPGAPGPKLERAILLERLGRKEESQQALIRMLAEGTANGMARRECRRLSIELGREIEFLEAWTEAFPPLGDRIQLANLQARRQPGGDQAAYWVCARLRWPRNPWVALLAGEALARSGRINEAIAELERSLEMEVLPRAAASLSALVREARPPREAIRYFEARVRKDPRDPHSLWALGESRAEAGAFEQSLDDFYHAIALDPDECRWYRLNRILRPRLPPGALRRIWERAAASFPGSAAVRILLDHERRPDRKPEAIRFRAGDGPIHDRGDRHWDGDRFFLGGIAARGLLPSLDGDLDPTLFRSYRQSSPGDPEPIYAIPAPDGEYEISIFAIALDGRRGAFELRVEGEPLPWPDLSAGQDTLVLRRVVSVRDGFLDIDALPLLDEARIAGIEIEPRAAAAAAAAPSSGEPDHAAACPGALRLLGDRRRDAGDWRSAVDAYRRAHRIDAAAFPDYWARAHGAMLRNHAPEAERRAFLEDERRLSGDRREIREILELEGRFAAGPSPLRINSGGEEYRDRQGNLWLSDRFHLNGSARSTPLSILGTGDGALYRVQREREVIPFVPLRYAIPVLPGMYRITLHFAEVMPDSHLRRFDIFIEDRKVLAGLNLWSASGFRTALSKSFDMEVEDGVLDLTLSCSDYDGRETRPVIAAIEVNPL